MLVLKLVSVNLSVTALGSFSALDGYGSAKRAQPIVRLKLVEQCIIKEPAETYLFLELLV